MRNVEEEKKSDSSPIPPPAAPDQHCSGGRVRPRSVSEDDTTPQQTAVRSIGFSCEHRGRYFRSSKRRIRWYVQPYTVLRVHSCRVGALPHGAKETAKNG